MAGKKERRISKKRIGTYLTQVNAKLKQESKLAKKIAETDSMIEKLTANNSSQFAIKMYQNKRTALNSQLLAVQKRRNEAERKFGNSVRRNDSLNGDSSSELVEA